jgi:two-component system, OmpR family, KDP operon response regulator KdpE
VVRKLLTSRGLWRRALNDESVWPVYRRVILYMSAQRILIVDDNAVLVKALKNTLHSRGYDVLTAEDGAEAVRIARNEQPDLVLLDISFPPDVAHGGGVPWDGFLIMNWLSRMDEARDIPIVIISGAAAAEYRERALAAGAVNYLQKPFEPDELLAAVRDVVGEPPPTPATEPATPSSV